MGRELQIRRRGRFRYSLSLAEQREDPSLSFNQWAELINSFTFQGLRYTTPGGAQEDVGTNFSGMARGAYRSNGVVFATILVRQSLFSEARFQFRRFQKGRPQNLFGGSELAPLENPGQARTTGDLLSEAIVYHDIGGNWFGTNRYGGIKSLRPDWMTFIAGSPESDASIWDPSTELLGYSYQPGGPGSGEEPIGFLPEEIAHFAMVKDPEARFRGMSWLTPIVREVMADKAFTDHKLNHLEHGATPNLVVKTTFEDLERMMPWVEKFREQHEGSHNAARTLFLGAGQDAVPVGTNLKDLDFKAVQGAGETRIAAAGGVPPVIIGLSEGLEAATYSNYALAMRRFADVTMRPLWRNFAASVSNLITVPSGAELWYDTRDIAALRQDELEAAEVRQRNAATIASYIINGWTPESARDAVLANDESLLEHTGLVSVQLQEPGSDTGGALPTLPGTPGEKPTAKKAPADNGRDHALDMLAELAFAGVGKDLDGDGD